MSRIEYSTVYIPNKDKSILHNDDRLYSGSGREGRRRVTRSPKIYFIIYYILYIPYTAYTTYVHTYYRPINTTEYYRTFTTTITPGSLVPYAPSCTALRRVTTDSSTLYLPSSLPRRNSTAPRISPCTALSCSVTGRAMYQSTKVLYEIPPVSHKVPCSRRSAHTPPIRQLGRAVALL